MTEHTPALRGITPEQYDILLRSLNSTRVAHRQQSGKNLSYLEAWDVKAHLTRVFGFGNWDSEVVDYGYIATREYESNSNPPKPMVEVIYRARVQLTIRDQHGNELCRHSEVAVGSTSGPVNLLGEHHDNAVKTAASDALKRCAINLGSQFGLSLYNNGSTKDVIMQTLVPPAGWAKPAQTEEQQAAVQQITDRLDAQPVQPEEHTPVQPAEVHSGNTPQAEPATHETAPAPPTEQAISRAQVVDQVRTRKDALSTEQQNELREWWQGERLPTLTRLTADKAQLVLARIELIEKQALVADRLGGQPVEEGEKA